MTGTSPAAFTRFLATAHDLADAATAAIRPRFRRPIRVDNKDSGSGYDPVTEADRAAERAMTRLLAKTWPDHGIAGEEYGEHAGAARYRWVLDPIDGTKSFVMGSPLWGTLIGLLDEDQPVLGLMEQPFTRERFWSSARGSHLRIADGPARRLKTRRCNQLADATVATTHPDLFAAGVEAHGFAEIKSRARMTRFGGDCYNYCLLAAGFVDVVIEAGLKSHDVAALIPIVERAGGRMTTWDGCPAAAGGRILASGDPHLHDKVLRALS